MKSTFKSNFFNSLQHEESKSPDEYVRSDGKPQDSFIISRSSSGKPVSYYKDETWDLRPYRNRGASGQATLHFKFNDRKTIDEAKWLMFLLMFVAKPQGRSHLSVMTIMNYMKSVREIVRYSEINNIEISNIFYKVEELERFISTLNTRNLLSSFSAILHHLLTIPIEISGYKILGIAKNKILNEKLINVRPDSQHPVIPPRILSELINQLGSFIKDIDSNLNNLLSFIDNILSDSQFGRSDSMQRKLGYKVKVNRPGFVGGSIT